MSRDNLNFRNWEFSVDRQKTFETYQKIEVPGAESCGCDNCLNFASQRSKIYPNEIKELFDKFGIDWRMETEVSHYSKIAPDLHHYGGWFHFKGNFQGPNCEIPMPNGNGHALELTTITHDFSIGFRYENSLTAFEEANGLVQIEFECEIPWVLKDKSETE